MRVFKAFFMMPSDIDTAAVAIAEHRPDLDADAARAAGEAYATRLERMRWLFSTPAGRTGLVAPQPITLPGYEEGEPWYPAGNAPVDGEDSAQTAPRGTLAHRRPGHPMPLRHGGATAGGGDPEQIAAHARGDRPTPRRSDPYPSEPRPRLHAEKIHELQGAEVAVPELLVQALNLPWDNGRLRSEALAKALRMSEHELVALLGPLGSGWPRRRTPSNAAANDAAVTSAETWRTQPRRSAPANWRCRPRSPPAPHNPHVGPPHTSELGKQHPARVAEIAQTPLFPGPEAPQTPHTRHPRTTSAHP